MSYVSNELTHFVGRADRSDEERFARLIKILGEGRLHSPLDPGHPYSLSIGVSQGGSICDDQTLYLRSMVCFCDIPLDHLAIHMGKYGRFGLAFSKGWLVPRGASPVFYVASNSALRTAAPDPEVRGGNRGEVFNRRANQHSELWLGNSAVAKEPMSGPVAAYLKTLRGLQVFQSISMFAHVKCFDASLSEDDPRNYYMEREWRVTGRVEFALEDLARIIVPMPYGPRLTDAHPALVDRLHMVR